MLANLKRDQVKFVLENVVNGPKLSLPSSQNGPLEYDKDDDKQQIVLSESSKQLEKSFSASNKQGIEVRQRVKSILLQIEQDSNV